MLEQECRSPLKWPGGKKRVLPHIRTLLPSDNKKRLIEPFVGGGSVFLNSEFDEYVLCDTNADLISLYKALKSAPKKFISQARTLFTAETNSAECYYELRDRFNLSKDTFERALLFLYLNRHGYNGLCRYNLKGEYNVPFGQYKKPYFPEFELLNMAKKLKRAKLILGDFEKAFKRLRDGDVIYCDPPYAPINATSNFTAYSGVTFSAEDQKRLVKCALVAAKKNIPTLISNHHTPFTKELYASAKEKLYFTVQRSISQKGQKREKVKEVLALY